MSTDSKHALIHPSIALPTGPYDWHPERHPRAVYEARVERLQAMMTEHGLTHVVVHGNGFDHAALFWLTHFTPKLGPAYALVPLRGPLRLLFAGGPGMKPSAQKLTWVEDVSAIKNVTADVKRWLDETAFGASVRVGLVEGSSMLRGDWRAVKRAIDADAIELDAHFDDIGTNFEPRDPSGAAADAVFKMAFAKLRKSARIGIDLRSAVIDMEREAYAKGAQDIRVRIARKPGGRPTTIPDKPLPMSGATEVAIALRVDGAWVRSQFLLEPMS